MLWRPNYLSGSISVVACDKFLLLWLYVLYGQACLNGSLKLIMPSVTQRYCHMISHYCQPLEGLHLHQETMNAVPPLPANVIAQNDAMSS